MNRLALQHISENTIISAAKLGGVAAILGGKPAHDGAEQDGDKGRALDQSVAGRQLRAGEMVGENAVFDRPEQRRDHAEQEQRKEQHGYRMQGKAEHGNKGDCDLRKLEPLRHHRLVVAVGKLAAERRQKKVGRDEDGSRQRDERFGVRASDLEENEKDQRIFEEIVTEGGKELGPEQRREAPRHEQGRGHGFPSLDVPERPVRSVGWVARERNPFAARLPQVTGDLGFARRKTKRAASGSPAFQVRSANADATLPAEGPLPRWLHQDCCNAQTNGSSRRDSEKRDPHGAIPSFCFFIA